MPGQRPERQPQIRLQQTAPLPMQLQPGQPVTVTMQADLIALSYAPYDYIWHVAGLALNVPQHAPQCTFTLIPPLVAPGQEATLAQVAVSVVDIFGQVTKAAAPARYRTAPTQQAPTRPPLYVAPPPPPYRRQPDNVGRNALLGVISAVVVVLLLIGVVYAIGTRNPSPQPPDNNGDNSGNRGGSTSIATDTPTDIPTATFTPTPTDTPTPTPTFTPTITPTSVPVVALNSSTPSWTQDCTAGVLQPLTMELDNSGSNVAVSWSTGFDEVGTTSHPWGVANPASGVIGAGQVQDVAFTITDQDLCGYLPVFNNPPANPQDLSVQVYYGNGAYLNRTDVVIPPAPPPPR